MCCALVVVLLSCKSVEVVDRSEVQDVQKFRSVDTVVVRDSVFVSEKMRGDTVYLTRIEYRDRWRTQIVHDTIQDTQVVEKIIEQPPERYVPKFYKWCTVILFALLALVAARWWLKRKL